MAEAGIIRDGERVELLDGALVEMSPIGGPHWTIHAVLVPYLATRLTGRALVAGQASVALGDFDEPQPDILIVPPTPAKFARTRPEPGEILAIIEIADSSLAKDTKTKRLLYEKFGIRDYLVVDVGTQTLLHYRLRDVPQYGEPERLRRGEYVSLDAFPDVRLDVDRFLTPRD
jgi:Uma2 family endonuclease